jgi:hypothetical protein
MSRTFLLRLLIIAAFIIGGLVFRDRISGNASDLKVGDCFDVPTANIDIKDVQHHPCTEPHTGEVIFVGDHAAAKGTTFTDSLITDFAQSTCFPAADTYLGTADAKGLDIGAFFPQLKGWNDGQRGITCYLYEIGGSSISRTLQVDLTAPRDRGEPTRRRPDASRS